MKSVILNSSSLKFNSMNLDSKHVQLFLSNSLWRMVWGMVIYMCCVHVAYGLSPNSWLFFSRYLLNVFLLVLILLVMPNIATYIHPPTCSYLTHSFIWPSVEHVIRAWKSSAANCLDQACSWIAVILFWLFRYEKTIVKNIAQNNFIEYDRWLITYKD